MAFGNVHPCSFSLPPIHVGHPALFQAVLPTVLERTRSLGTLRSAGRHGHPGAPWLPLDSHGLEQPCLSLAFWEVLSKRRTGREGRAGSRCQGPLMISLVTCVSLDSFLEQLDRLQTAVSSLHIVVGPGNSLASLSEESSDLSHGTPLPRGFVNSRRVPPGVTVNITCQPPGPCCLVVGQTPALVLLGRRL